MKLEPLTKDKIGLLPENYSDKCIFIGDIKNAVEGLRIDLARLTGIDNRAKALAFLDHWFQLEEKEIKEEFICPNCKSKLSYSLKEQIRGNNCNCGFPDKAQRSFFGRIKIRRNL